MYEDMRMSAGEWELVIELLERERSELPAEIHHTRTTRVRQELKNRLHVVDEMLGRLRSAAVV